MKFQNPPPLSLLLPRQCWDIMQGRGQNGPQCGQTSIDLGSDGVLPSHAQQEIWTREGRGEGVCRADLRG